MPNERIGYAGTILKEIPNSPRITKTASGPDVREIFHANYEDAEAAIAARGIVFGDACPIAAYAAAKLFEISIDKGGPQNARITYKYKIPDAGGDPGSQPVGTISWDSDSNTIEIPIGQHPNATSLNYDSEKNIGIGDWKGVESYISPQPVFTRTEILAGFTFSEANIISNVAKRMTAVQMATAGMSSATDSKWLKMSLAVSVASSNFQKTERYQYASKAWDGTIYDDAV